jgi:peptide/nickel transport system permease protein
MAWRRFRQNKLAMAGLVLIAVAMMVAVLGAYIRPDGNLHANTQELSLARKGINFNVEVLRVQRALPPARFLQGLFFGESPAPYREVPLHSYALTADSIVGHTYGGDKSTPGMPLAMHLLEVVAGAKAESITCDGEVCRGVNDLGEAVSAPLNGLRDSAQRHHIATKRFILGTDRFGRDMLSRLMAGTLVSLSVGLISVLISLVLGVGMGAIGGYFGGFIDDAITWLINVVWSIPTLLLVIAITFALGKGFVQVFVAVGLTMWVEVARVVRGQVLSARQLEYVEAARALGYSTPRIVGLHLLPNIMAPVIVISAANFASAILLEAGLSFLGIGAQIPMASWGQMIKDHYAYITTDMAYLAILPGACIMMLVLAFMLVGAGLRDVLDTRS